MKRVRWKTVKASISAAAGVAAALATSYLGWAETHPGHFSNPLDIASLSVDGAVAVVSTGARPFRIFAKDKEERLRSRIATALRSLPWTVHDLSDGAVPVRPLGASAWLLKGHGDHERLRRVGRERVNDDPAPSTVQWTKGKGVVGRCWASKRLVIDDLSGFDARYGKCTEAEWNDIPASERRGLDYVDHIQLTGKYGTIIAAPIHDGEGFIGIVGLDCPPGHHERLNQDDIKEAVASTATMIATLIEGL